MSHLLKKIFPYNLALLAFSGISDALPIHLPLAIIWLLNCLVFYSVYYTHKYTPRKVPYIINIYLIWNIICIIHGCFVAERYWDWKLLISTGFGMLMPIFSYVFISPRCNVILLRNLIKSALIFFPILLLFLPSSDRPGRYLTFFYLFMICISALPKKWKIITLIVFLFSCLYSLEARSNVIRAVVAICIGSLYYVRYRIARYLKIVQCLFLYIPFALLILAVTQTFNIFKINNYWKNSTITTFKDGKGTEIDLGADTRTLLYQEVILSAIKNHHVIWGASPARGYESQYFTLDTYQNRNMNMRIGERHGTEVSVLNIFLHTGLIGLILYFSIFYYSSYLGIFKSRNIYIKLIGLFIIFRWCYGWIEDFNQFDINYAMLWMFISMCISPYFRSMSNMEFKQWLLSIIK